MQSLSRAYGNGDISIHAPPRGATARQQALERQLNISIHAPPRGATMLGDEMMLRYMISIHAPPRGATAPLPHPVCTM